jgi:SAM-dependent methyltransferase
MRGPTIGDAFGMAFLAHLEGRSGVHFVERDDGVLEALDAAVYFAGPEEWSDRERDLVASASGTVLDVGAGAGRHALALQERGLPVLALDPSPGAVETMRARGVHDTFLGSVYDLDDGARFDTFLLLGNNLGLVGSPNEAPRFLARLRSLAAPGARILGSCIDPYQTDDPLHLSYHERNRAAGRPGGQITIRIRYQNVSTEWFDLLWMTTDDLAALAGPSGWRLAEHGTGPVYWAVLEAV